MADTSARDGKYVRTKRQSRALEIVFTSARKDDHVRMCSGSLLRCGFIDAVTCIYQMWKEGLGRRFFMVFFSFGNEKKVVFIWPYAQKAVPLQPLNHPLFRQWTTIINVTLIKGRGFAAQGGASCTRQSYQKTLTFNV